jgi:hypothetical protein
MIQHKGFTVAPLVVRVITDEKPEPKPKKWEWWLLLVCAGLVSFIFWAGIIAAGFGAHWIWKWMVG